MQSGEGGGRESRERIGWKGWRKRRVEWCWVKGWEGMERGSEGWKVNNPSGKVQRVKKRPV